MFGFEHTRDDQNQSAPIGRFCGSPPIRPFINTNTDLLLAMSEAGIGWPWTLSLMRLWLAESFM
jgi:hypothetical protein